MPPVSHAQWQTACTAPTSLFTVALLSFGTSGCAGELHLHGHSLLVRCRKVLRPQRTFQPALTPFAVAEHMRDGLLKVWWHLGPLVVDAADLDHAHGPAHFPFTPAVDTSPAGITA